MTDELKACPHCQGKLERYRDDDMPISEVVCTTKLCHYSYGPYNDLDDGWQLIVEGCNTRPIEDALRTQNAELVKALEEVREIYAGMDGFCPLTAPEAYQDKILKDIWGVVREALEKAKG